MKRVLAAALAAALAATNLIAPQAQAIQLRCHPVHVIQAAGTGFSHSWHPVARDTLFDDSSSPADDLQLRFGARNVTTFQVKYPASLGRFSALGSAGVGPEGTEAATYGESVAYGREVAVQEMEYVARSCPSTRFILIGYSQGAHLIGDAAAEVAAGRARGVHPDNIAAVVLFADPGRAELAEPVEKQKPSRLYAPPPLGERAANFETVQAGGTRIPPRTVGMAGTRRTSFNGLQGKVLSLCNGADMACATDPDSVIRALADVAMREVWVGPFNAVTGMRVAELTAALGAGMPFPEALEASGLSLIDVTLAPLILAEVSMALRALYDHTAAGNPFPPEQLLAAAVLTALPNLAKEGVAWPWLLPALHGVRDALAEPLGEDGIAWVDVALDVLHAVDQTERLTWELQHLGVLPHTPTGTEGRRVWAFQTVSVLMDHAIDAAGLRPVVEHPANANLIASARLAGDFGPRHMSYYKRGYTHIAGGFAVPAADGAQTGYDYAMDWMSSVVAGVLAAR